MTNFLRLRFTNLPVIALSTIAIATAITVGCHPTDEHDAGMSEDMVGSASYGYADYGDDGYGYGGDPYGYGGYGYGGDPYGYGGYGYGGDPHGYGGYGYGGDPHGHGHDHGQGGWQHGDDDGCAGPGDEHGHRRHRHHR